MHIYKAVGLGDIHDWLANDVPLGTVFYPDPYSAVQGLRQDGKTFMTIVDDFEFTQVFSWYSGLSYFMPQEVLCLEDIFVDTMSCVRACDRFGRNPLGRRHLRVNNNRKVYKAEIL